eukprot:Phypoly_transcript_04716.p2 GENE.Phypoly_transcript_04716~~Phypoly_transcript_04716.p2  ORF type:complete len:277 (+),score=47.98 Phypoly_transcript_04716:1176-2006(+)
MDDVILAEGLNETQKAQLFAQISSTCESGWDFSSRWMANKSNMATLQTNQIIPVDLNSILYANEISLSNFHHMMHDDKLRDYYLRNSKKRYTAIQKFLFDPATSQWNDYHFVTQKLQTDFYASVFVPLWAGAFDPSNATLIDAVLNQIESLLHFPAGVPTSVFDSSQQWDFPNGWAPLQYFIIHGLRKISEISGADPNQATRAKALALSLAQKWVATNHCGYLKTGKMFEKYNVTSLGQPGGGGQYSVQWGFGWTNGVILDLFVNYGSQLKSLNCP